MWWPELSNLLELKMKERLPRCQNCHVWCLWLADSIQHLASFLSETPWNQPLLTQAVAPWVEHSPHGSIALQRASNVGSPCLCSCCSLCLDLPPHFLLLLSLAWFQQTKPILILSPKPWQFPLDKSLWNICMYREKDNLTLVMR